MTRRTFLITGASKGIGRAVAEHLDRAGHRVVGIARTPDLSFPGTLFPLDLGDRTLTREVLADLASQYEFDGLVNNVGLVRPQVLGEIDLDTFDDVMRVNLHSALQTTQTLLPNMRAKGWGRVVNISSLTVLGITQRTAYAAAKAALVSFTRSWALELAQTGITVNAVAPARRKRNCSERTIRLAAKVKRVIWLAYRWAGWGNRKKSLRRLPFCCPSRAGSLPGRHCLSMVVLRWVKRRFDGFFQTT